MKSVGLREVFVGIESGCKKQLGKRYKKGTTKENNIAAIKTLRNLGLEVDLGFIFFDEDSDIPEARKNLNFIYEAEIFNHDSQLIKRVRIEPRTPLGFKYAKQHPSATVDLNLVEIPYKFKHIEIETIFYTFSDWQKKDLDVIYNLQSFCRGEIPSGYTRAEIKKIIGKYRQLDIAYLDELVKVFENGQPYKDQQIKKVTVDFENKRNELDASLIERIKWLNSNFRRFEI